MKIINRQEFLTMPSGTVFMKFPAQPKDRSYTDLGYEGAIAIKDDTVGNDFVAQDLFPWFEGCADSGEWTDVMFAMIEGKESPPLDYDCAGRDGLFDNDQLFLVWAKDDLERMISRLKLALVAGYS